MALTQTFKAKIVTLIMLAVAGMLLLATLSFWQVRTLMLDGRKAQLTAAVQSARSIVDAYQKQAAGGTMSVADAQSAAREALRAARYGDSGSDYFYIWTLDGVSVMLPSKPEWAGQNMIGKVKDAAGTDVIQSMTSAAKASETGWAFVLTQFPHPGGTEPAPKLQLVTVVREWNWMVGSGLYMDEAEAQVHAALFKMAGFALAMILALGTVGAWVARVVLRQLGGEPAHAVAVMRRLAQGDLRTEAAAAPEGSLLFELQRTIVSLRVTVCGVRDSIDSITTASAEIAAGGLDLSRRTEQAAANLQQTAATMEQLTGSVSAAARSAREAGQLADQACATAVEGRQSVGQVVATMGGIQLSSQRIAEITGVIDGIAFQTNILALNAAVEAARAGDQGRGFAVVAGEVRTLAQRSAQAAREIKSLIQVSVERVRDGGREVEAAGAAIQSLVDRVGHVQGTVSRITQTAIEQAGRIGEVGNAVAELDRVTQQNAALVEQSGAAAESLREQADALRRAMAVFQL